MFFLEEKVVLRTERAEIDGDYVLSPCRPKADFSLDERRQDPPHKSFGFPREINDRQDVAVGSPKHTGLKIVLEKTVSNTIKTSNRENQSLLQVSMKISFIHQGSWNI